MNDIVKRLGILLDRYISVHDDIFAFSWRRLIPILGIFQAIDFRANFASLRTIETSLQDIISEIEQAPCRDGSVAEVLLGYSSALRKAVSELREICHRLVQKADGEKGYAQSVYSQDVAKYDESVLRYQEWGGILNQRLYS